MQLDLAPRVSLRLFPWNTTAVRLQDDARKCVVFLGNADSSGAPETFEACATGFFVCDTEDRVTSTYLVTAKHCVTTAGLSDPFHIRFNGQLRGPGRKAEPAFTQLVENPEWVFSEDPDVDLAVIEFAPPPEADVLHFPLRGMWSRTLPAVIGPGDLTYTVGLFQYLPGESRNITLVHCGHIAAFPEDELVPVPDWDRPHDKNARKEIEAYIVQCTAMPGASGSPVFVRKPAQSAPLQHVHDERRSHRVAVTSSETQVPTGYGDLYLLGVWHGSWDVQVKAFQQIRNPAGYGIVIPSKRIQEILDMPKLKKGREQRRAEKKSETMPKLDSLPRRKAQERFDETLTKMLNTPPQPRVSDKS